MIGDAHRELMRAQMRSLLRLITKTAAEVERDMMRSEKMEKSGGALMEAYWMVHRPGPGGGPPTKTYDDFGEALTEAKRLARKENEAFVILESIRMVLPYIMLHEEDMGLGTTVLDDFLKKSGAEHLDSLDPDDDPSCDCAGFGRDEEFIRVLRELRDAEMIPKASCPCGCTDEPSFVEPACAICQASVSDKCYSRIPMHEYVPVRPHEESEECACR